MKAAILALLAAAMALVASACSPQTRVISTPCIDASQLPPETPKPMLTGNAGIDLAIMTRTALELLDEAEKLRALTRGCV